MGHPNGELGTLKSEKPIWIDTFNAALFSMAPAIPEAEKRTSFEIGNGDIMNFRRSMNLNLHAKSVNDRPKSILKQSPLHPNSMNGTNYKQSFNATEVCDVQVKGVDKLT